MKNKIAHLFILCFTLILQLILIGMPIKVNAVTTIPEISYSINGNTTVGSIFDINVNVSNITGLYGTSLDFKYDPSLIEVISIGRGTLLSNPNLLEPIKSIADGQGSLALTLKGINNGISGTGYLFTIKAKALKEGALNLKTITDNSQLSPIGNNIRVKLIDKNINSISYTSKDMNVSIVKASPVTITSLTTDKVSPKPLGSTIKLTANASGGTALLYQFYVNDGSGWTIVQKYSSSNILNWTPSKIGNYNISVYVKDKYSSKFVDSLLTLKYSITTHAPVKVNSLTTDKVSPQPLGSTIKLTANASGGSSLLYQFYVNDGSGWKVVQNYSSSNILNWTPSKTGNYTISVYAKDKYSSNYVDSFLSLKYTCSN